MLARFKLLVAGPVGLILLSHASSAGAHGLHLTPEQQAGLLLITLSPALGAETLHRSDREPKLRLVASWQFAIPLERQREAVVRHRLLLAAELTGDGELRGRAGYRLVLHPVFFGGGAALGRDLGTAGTAELGWRFFSFKDEGGAALYAVAHTHVGLGSGHPFTTGALVGITFS